MPKDPFGPRSPAKTCRHWSKTYQRVINGEAKSCRDRAKSLSHGYNPVNFAAEPTPCPIPSKKIPCSLFCTSPRRDVFAGINCCFGVCLRLGRASQWASAEILPQQREKLHNQRNCNAAGSCNVELRILRRGEHLAVIRGFLESKIPTVSWLRSRGFQGCKSLFGSVKIFESCFRERSY